MDPSSLPPNSLQWTEAMRGSQWRALVAREQETWKSITKELPVSLAERQIEAAAAPFHASLFEAARGRIRIAFAGTLSYHWSWADTTQSVPFETVSDLEARAGDWVWTVRDSGDGSESYCLEAWRKGRAAPVWRMKEVGPFVAVVGSRVFVLERKKHLVYFRLVSYDCKTGRQRQVHYEEHDFRYNLELIRGGESWCWLRRQAGTKQDVFQFTERGQGIVLEGISLEPRRFVLGSRPGEALIWQGRSGWEAKGLPGGVRLPVLGPRATPETLDTARGLLVTKCHGRRTIWRIQKGQAPYTIWSGYGTVMIDPWDGPWVRISQAGCSVVWWNSQDGPARPVDNWSLCRHVTNHFVKSKDGTKVNYVLVRPLTHLSTRPAGLLVIGYGAYGIPLPMMTARWEPLLQAGWALAFGLWRGGGDHTPEWEDEGRLAGRVRVLEDAEAIVRDARRRTGVPAARTVGYGRSAGGLWVGGLAAKFPDGSLMGGIYSEVGYLDAFRTILNRDLPLTEIETDEFGLPAMRVEDGRIAMEWSPMDLLSPKGTPGMWQIVRTALNDKEVLAYESVKWVLRSRAGRSASASKIFLAIPGGQGHFVAQPARQQAEDACLLLTLAGTK